MSDVKTQDFKDMLADVVRSGDLRIVVSDECLALQLVDDNNHVMAETDSFWRMHVSELKSYVSDNTGHEKEGE